MVCILDDGNGVVGEELGCLVGKGVGMFVGNLDVGMRVIGLVVGLRLDGEESGAQWQLSRKIATNPQ